MYLAISMTEEKENLGQRLKRLRSEKGLRQEDLALLVGVSQQTIGNIERGGSNSIKMPEIAEALGVTLKYLKTGEGNPKADLQLIESNSVNKYTAEEIANALPGAYDKTVNTVRNFLFQQGKLIDGDVPLIANKELFLSVLTKAVLMEVTNDLMINDIISQEFDKTNNS